MTKPDLGTKHLCPGCGTKFYDLKRTPITCPKCGTVVSIAATKGSGGRAAKAAVVETEATPDVADAKEENVDIVSLEEADAEQIGSSKKSTVVDDDDDDDVDVDVDDVDDIDDDAADDDTFLEDDEDDDAVPDIVVVRETDEDL